MMTATSDNEARRHLPGLTGASLATIVALMLTGCGQNQPSTEDDALSSSTPSVTARESAATPSDAQAIRDVDFDHQVWTVYRLGDEKPTIVDLASGESTDRYPAEYEVLTDQILYSDATGNGAEDALVPIQAYWGGNGLETYWYIWVVQEDGTALQSHMPVVQQVNCGTVVESVDAVDGGFQITELRRDTEGEDSSCAAAGTDRRVRTVGITQDGLPEPGWPIQIEPFIGYGGVCPTSTPDAGTQNIAASEYADATLYAAATTDAPHAG